MSPIDKVLNIAKQELGYLEKRSNAYLYDKTANAGSGNYTKYWAEIKPDYQGQPWCACFVTWCFVQAFGQSMATKLLKHYPYVYCPTMARLFTLNANPKVGDIVIFKRNGEFTHTGIVNGVNGDYFTTYEGNTSGASGI
ncbi:MAG: CHAP domain-containing protein, partial [Erysipelotrichaceae bacterium]|nr:CHAP domain-containing protein [Erysipelotrichaceae bacterium]